MCMGLRGIAIDVAMLDLVVQAVVAHAGSGGEVVAAPRHGISAGGRQWSSQVHAVVSYRRPSRVWELHDWQKIFPQKRQ